MTRTTAAQRELLYEDYRHGDKVVDLAAGYSLSQSRVYQIIREHQPSTTKQEQSVSKKTALNMVLVDQEAPDRDRWGRPRIDGVSYSRASTVSKALSDTDGLTKWLQRMTAVGVAESEDLINAIAADPTNTRAITGFVEQAVDRAGGTSARTKGTAIHSAVEVLFNGGSIKRLPEKVREDALAIKAALDEHEFTPVMSEVFTVCNELQIAGSFDYLLRDLNGKYAILDLKTGSSRYTRDVEWAVQTAIYAHSRPWCAKKGDLGWKKLGVKKPSIEVGIIAHLLQGSASCQLYTVNLVEGWDRAKTAVKAREARKTRGILTKIESV